MCVCVCGGVCVCGVVGSIASRRVSQCEPLCLSGLVDPEAQERERGVLISLPRLPLSLRGGTGGRDS